MPLTETNASQQQEIAAIDLGSNSFHMVIARVVNGALQVLGRLKQRVRLADGLDKDNVLSEEAMLRGLNCLSLFAERLQGFPINSVRIVATHTLRQAVNSQAFLERAKEILPYPIEIISGQEEARLIFMGVAHTQPEKGRKLVLDIGGGSTEMVIGEDFTPFSPKAAAWAVSAFLASSFQTVKSASRTSTELGLLRNKSWKAWPYSTKFTAGSTPSVHQAPSKRFTTSSLKKWVSPTALLRRSGLTG